MKQEKLYDEQYLLELEDISFKPIFILGLHRSGTTILYKMLNETKQFDVVTAYHILNYEKILYNHINNLKTNAKDQLNQLFKDKGVIDRKIDHIKVNADYAHEYGYILSKHSSSNKINNKNLRLFNEMCKKIKYVSKNKKPLLLKNPFDYANFIFIKKNFPNARFIFITRKPLNIINSTMKVLNDLMNEKNNYAVLFSKKYNKYFENPLLLNTLRFYCSSLLPFGLFRVINQSAKETKFFLKNIKKIPEEDYMIIRYEDLCTETNKIMMETMDFLKIKSDIDFNRYISVREIELLPNVNFLKKFIEFKMK